MKLSDFDYHLPKELIAQYPAPERDRARLLVLDRSNGNIEHKIFKDITGYFRNADLLVLNDTKVLRCRLLGRRASGGKVEVFLLKQKQGLVFEAMIRPARIRTGEKIIFADPRITATLIGRNEVSFTAGSAEEIYAQGVIPLPPYIKRSAEDLDSEYYQTVYACHNGSVASPTAGLHFTPGSLEEIRKTGTDIAYVTLHVGAATFKPVTSEDITKHEMGREFFTISEENLNKLNKYFPSRGQGRVFAVGTTSCRTLEAFASGQKQGETELFIYPGYKFRMVDCLLTNFHLPKTTLFMLVCAFCGLELAKRAYSEAVKEKYRFYSYGDAMLIL
jgi:S-adenosylmethionine:tRNA ribosyltransferase-isomerase